MLTIPLAAIPSQTVAVTLANQQCTINIYQNSTGLFCDLYVNNVLIIGGVICEDRNRIVRSAYLGFIGDLAFLDTQGNSDPFYEGLASRFAFLYLQEADIA